MKVTKAVRFQYHPDEELKELFNTFRQMANDAIRTATKHRITSRFKLIKTASETSRGMDFTHIIPCPPVRQLARSCGTRNIGKHHTSTIRF